MRSYVSVGASLLLVVLPAGTASGIPGRPWQVTTVVHAGAAVEGGGVSGLAEGFAFTAPDGSGDNASLDLLPEDMECLTDSADVDVTASRDLATASVTGTVDGTCFDVVRQVGAPYTAEVDLTWTATGPATRTTFVSRPEGRFCVTTVTSRPVTASGAASWEAPDFDLGGPLSPVGGAFLDRSVSVCRR